MTVVVAVRCQDGAVIGADSQATEIASQVKWPVTKLFQIGDQPIVWGASGQTAIIAEIKNELNGSLSNIDQSSDLHRTFQTLIQPVLSEQYGRFLNPTNDPNQIPNTCAVACGMKGEIPFIIEMEANGMCAELDRDWHAIGSGAGFAFLAGSMLEHFGFGNRSVAEGTLMVFRALSAVVSTAMFGVGAPLQIWQITSDGCHELGVPEMDQLLEKLSGWQEIEQDALQKFMGARPGVEADLPSEMPGNLD
jgi:20S proteasome alpha/beta subunit